MLARLTSARERWAGLAPRACPCCVGRVELQGTLARLLREQRPERILVELPSEEHLKTLERVLAQWPLGRYLEPARSLLLPEDAGVRPEDLETR